MKDYIYEILKNQNSISINDMLMRIGIAIILGTVIFVSYYVSHKGTIYSKKFNVSLVVLTTLTSTVMTVIGNNIALSLGMVGALSIVRFRTVVKDSRDTVYIFWTIVVGICCGVGDYTVASIGSAACFVVLLLFGGIKNDNRMMLIIRGTGQADKLIESTVYKYFGDKAILRVRNTSDKSMEYIYEITRKTWNSAKDKGNVTEELYKDGNVQVVNLVAQNDDISS